MTEVLSAIFLLTGCFFILLTAIGILNMPDLLCRAHALTKALTLGIALILLAVLTHFFSILPIVKVVLAILFQLITIPLAGHIFALYAYSQETEERARETSSGPPATEKDRTPGT